MLTGQLFEIIFHNHPVKRRKVAMAHGLTMLTMLTFQPVKDYHQKNAIRIVTPGRMNGRNRVAFSGKKN